MAQTVWPLVQRKFGETTRQDAWWIQPVLVFLGLSTFIVYATWAAFQGTHFEYGPYLSPFYSPLLFGDSPHAWFGPNPTWWPSALPFSAALLILWAPGGFRVTCYYYRGAYYKAFWADPPGCTVGEPRKSYLGRAIVSAGAAEHSPLLSVSRHHLHRHPPERCRTSRYWFTDASGATHFGIGVGSLLLTANTLLLGGTPSAATRSVT